MEASGSLASQELLSDSNAGFLELLHVCFSISKSFGESYTTPNIYVICGPKYKALKYNFKGCIHFHCFPLVYPHMICENNSSSHTIIKGEIHVFARSQIQTDKEIKIEQR